MSQRTKALQALDLTGCTQKATSKTKVIFHSRTLSMGASKYCTVMLMVIAMRYHPGMAHSSDVKTGDQIQFGILQNTYSFIHVH